LSNIINQGGNGKKGDRMSTDSSLGWRTVSASGRRVIFRSQPAGKSGRGAVATEDRIPAYIRWCLLLFIFSIPFEAVDLGFGDMVSPARLAGLPFFLVCLFKPRLCFRRPSAPVWWFCIYLAIVAVEAFFIPPDLRRQALSPFLTIVQLVIFFWITINLFRNRELAGRALRTYALGVVVLAVGTLANVPGFAASMETHESVAAARVSALGYASNDLAAIAALGAVVLLGDFLGSSLKRGHRFLFGLAALPLIVVVLRTGSRAGVLALFAGLAVYLLPATGTRRQGLAVLLAAVVLLGVGYSAVTNRLIEDRFNAAYSYGDTAGHERIFRASLGMVAEKPVTGWGPVVGLLELGERLQYRASKGGAYAVRDTHNLLFYLLLEVGIVGTAPFIIGLWLVARAAWRGRRGPLGLMPLALIAVVLTVNLAHTFYGRKPMWLVMAVAVATAAGTKKAQHAVIRKTRVPRTVIVHTGSLSGTRSA
jgi:O-antigen ligase